MKTVNSDKFIKIIADEGKKITNANRDFFSDFIYLGKNDSADNYEEVGREIWKHFIKEENPDIIEMMAQIKDLQDANDELGELLLETDYRLLKLQIYGFEEI